jgi:glutamine synthetase
MALVRDLHSNAEAFLAARPAVRVVDLLLPDLCAVLRGKRVDRSDLAGVYERGMFLPGSMFALDVLGGTIQATGLGFDEGDADRACVPIPDSLYPAPWMGPSVAQLQVQMLDHDGGPFYGDPRHVLDAVLDRYAARGWKPVIAIELEFYLVDCERTQQGPWPSRRVRVTPDGAKFEPRSTRWRNSSPSRTSWAKSARPAKRKAFRRALRSRNAGRASGR